MTQALTAVRIHLAVLCLSLSISAGCCWRISGARRMILFGFAVLDQPAEVEPNTIERRYHLFLCGVVYR